LANPVSRHATHPPRQKETHFLIEKVARLGRLERPTSCFGGTRSIQLSYSRVVPLYHAAWLRALLGCFLMEWRRRFYMEGIAWSVIKPDRL
jgi:hypothetical protein